MRVSPTISSRSRSSVRGALRNGRSRPKASSMACSPSSSDRAGREVSTRSTWLMKGGPPASTGALSYRLETAVTRVSGSSPMRFRAASSVSFGPPTRLGRLAPRPIQAARGFVPFPVVMIRRSGAPRWRRHGPRRLMHHSRLTQTCDAAGACGCCGPTCRHCPGFPAPAVRAARNRRR